MFLLPVLFLPHQRAALYLYLPAALFWIGSVALAQRLIKWSPAENLLIVFVLIAIAWQYQKFSVPLAHRALNLYGIFRSNVRQLQTLMPAPLPKTTLFIIGLPEYMNVFSYGPCYSVRLIYKEPSIDCVIEKKPEEIRMAFEAHTGPKLLLTYKDGELLRSE